MDWEKYMWEVRCLCGVSCGMAALASFGQVDQRLFALKEVGGVPRITVDGVPCAGMCALPEPRLGPEQVTFSMLDFSALGVRFFSDIWWAKGKYNDWWLGHGRYDFDAFDRRMKGLLDASPDGFVFPRIKMDPPDWWAKNHPSEIRANEVRPDSEAWRTLYRRMLTDVVAHVEKSWYANRVMGYHLGALHGSEWMVWPWPREELPPVSHAAGDLMPPLETTVERRAYQRKRNKDISDALLDAAALVKRLTVRRKLVGAFYGYMGTCDHEDFARVVRSVDIDFFASPGSYEHRRAGQSGGYQSPYTASYRLHGKLYWDEADIRTYHAKTRAKYRCATAEESVGAIKRNLGYSLAGGWETWWFLLAGNDTFHDEEMLSPIRAALSEERETLERTNANPAEVAVFTASDEYLTSAIAERRGAPFRVSCKLNFHLETLPFTGVPYDSYEISDIDEDRLPEYKVYIFPNAFTLSAARRETIERKVRGEGKTAIWCVAPGYYDETSGTEGNMSAYVSGDGNLFFKNSPTVSELRNALRAAGVHIWTYDGDVIAEGRGYLMVHATYDGVHTINFPKAYSTREIFGASPARKETKSIAETMRVGETRVYRLEK